MLYRGRIRNLGLSIFFFVMLTYLAFHALSGERGVLAYFKLSILSGQLQTELDAVRIERLNLEHKVTLLRSDSLDLDLLDEQIRKSQGFADKNETVYFLK